MGGNRTLVACLGFVFDPVAQQIIQGIAPPELELAFAENPNVSTAGPGGAKRHAAVRVPDHGADDRERAKMPADP